MEPQMLPSGQVTGSRKILEKHPNIPVNLRGCPAELRAEDFDSAGTVAQEPEDEPDRGRFARAVQPQEAVNVARADLKIHRGESLEAAEVLRDPTEAQGRHSHVGDHIRAKARWKNSESSPSFW
jgi:hypothetical protein